MKKVTKEDFDKAVKEYKYAVKWVLYTTCEPIIKIGYEKGNMENSPFKIKYYSSIIDEEDEYFIDEKLINNLT